MELVNIYKDSNVVDVCVASARGERLDSNVREDADKLIKDLFKDPNPHNRYQIAQLVGFAVNDILKPQLTWIDQVADTKRVGFGDKAQFKVKMEGVRAFIQAKGATTQRSKIAEKAITLDTIDVSARPVINIVEAQNGLANMSDLLNDAAYQMNLKINQKVASVLHAGAQSWSSPYYASGSSAIVKSTIDPQIQFWARMGGKCTLLGDIAMVSQFAGLTGFQANSTTQQFSGNIINEQNMNGFIGTYIGQNVAQMINPPIDGTDTATFSIKHLYILPSVADVSMRPLKVVFEGDVFSTEATDINDLSFEVRLDQYFNAALVYGDRPYMGVYEQL